jgi:hypothetical protein
MHPTRIFKTPEELFKAFEEYKTHLELEAGKWLKIQYVGKEGERVTDKYKLPYTLEGFEIFCYNKYGCVSQYFDNKDGLYADFVAICSHIRKQIRDNQILGGMLGIYNPSITQRLNGLTEKTETKVEISDAPDWLKGEIK